MRPKTNEKNQPFSRTIAALILQCQAPCDRSSRPPVIWELGLYVLILCQRNFSKINIAHTTGVKSADALNWGLQVSGNNPIIAGMAGRYAAALFELAVDGGELDNTASDFNSFGKILDESEDLRRLISSPVFSAEDQQLAISAILKKAGIGGLVSNALQLITKNRRLYAAADIIKAFNAMHARHKGEIEAEVTSAVVLSADQLTELKSTLKSAMGQDVGLKTHVDPALLGGLVVKVGSRMIDSSLKTKLNNLETTMKEVG